MHDTPFKTGAVAPGGVGGLSALQLEPSHTSASGACVWAAPESPTARHHVEVTQETAFRADVVAPEGLPTWSILQPDPSIRSIRTSVVRTPAALTSICPTATQSFAAAQDTPERPVDDAPGLGICSIDQVEPLENSANGGLGLTDPGPTRVHAELAMHETAPPSAPPPYVRGGIGAETIVQLDPSQRSTSGGVEAAPGNGAELPTAVQSSIAAHETLTSPASGTARGLGVGWIDHRESRQRSVSGTAAPESLRKVEPTATQVAAEGHATSESKKPVAGFGPGSWATDHRPRVQRYARLWVWPFRVLGSRIAVQTREVGQSTLSD
jgi:hypothetical protein